MPVKVQAGSEETKLTWVEIVRQAKLLQAGLWSISEYSNYMGVRDLEHEISYIPLSQLTKTIELQSSKPSNPLLPDLLQHYPSKHRASECRPFNWAWQGCVEAFDLRDRRRPNFSCIPQPPPYGPHMVLGQTSRFLHPNGCQVGLVSACSLSQEDYLDSLLRLLPRVSTWPCVLSLSQSSKGLAKQSKVPQVQALSFYSLSNIPRGSNVVPFWV